MKCYLPWDVFVVHTNCKWQCIVLSCSLGCTWCFTFSICQVCVRCHYRVQYA